MSRWQPGAAGRLQAAALELYASRGYDETTVAEIAERAGLSERTFFRHFADKREVLFQGSDEFSRKIVAAVAAAPPDVAPLEVVARALEAIAPFFDGFRAHSARRHAIISAHSELQERELIKRATLVAAVAAALRERGVADPVSELTAEAGMIVFGLAYRRWVVDPAERGYADHVRATLAQLEQVAGGSAQLSPV